MSFPGLFSLDDHPEPAAADPAAAMASLQARIAPLQARLAAHPLYPSLRTIAHLRLFMQTHVYAVWDFMSLLKALQRVLTGVDVPWTPTRFPASRRFINEIVLGEESDEYEGRPSSHFEIYLEAMRRAGAETAAIEGLIARIESSPRAELDLRGIPAAGRTFVESTFAVIRQGSVAAQAAAFTFGREDAIPAMFRSLVRELSAENDGRLDLFIWYLERHIEVDGEDHGPLSLQMVADLCGDSAARWQEATEAAEAAIQARLALWDGILEQIQGGN